ncbi:MAG: LAGLIDADG family homing endonuclease [archaeon]|nr:LAGLIDADG family homing endonuclease [archaeon]
MKITQEVINLIKEGTSLNKINKITGFNKSTIYFHYKKIKGKKIKNIEINFKNENELGEFLGVFAGDGSFYKALKNYEYIIRIYIGYYEKHYAIYLKNKLMKWFNKKPHIYITNYKNNPSLITLHYSSKQIYNLIKNHLEWKGKKSKTVRLKKLDLKNNEFNLGFLRGLIDTDGSYYVPKRRISFSTISKELARQAYRIIKHQLKKSPKQYIIKKDNKADLYTLSLHGLEAKRLIDIIKPKNINKTYAVVV